MLRHDFRPGKAVAGLTLMVCGVLYLGVGQGWWDAPWQLLGPVVLGGFLLAAAVSGLDYGLRRRRSSAARRWARGEDDARATDRPGSPGGGDGQQ